MDKRLRVFAYWTVLLHFIIGSSDAAAQNLIVNGNFEGYNNCPASVSGIDFSPTFSSFPSVQNWVRPTVLGSSDYFNVCATVPGVGVPTNGFGYQQARSGNGYAGLFGFINFGPAQPAYREFITTKFSVPLKKDSVYCITLYASTAVPIQSGLIGRISVNCIGALISDTLPTTIPNPAMDPRGVIPNDTNVHLTDTARWYEIRGHYQADGGEEWLTIGAFYDGPLPPFTYLGNGSPLSLTNYTYIEDVSVVPDSVRPVSIRAQYCGAPLQLTSSSTAGPYKWSNGATGRATAVNAPGLYTCLSGQDCDAIRDSFIVFPTPVSDTLTETVTTVCKSENLNLKLSYPGIGSRYKWSTGDTTREITVQDTGSYTCEVLRNCRIYRARFDVKNAMPEPPIIPDTTVCQSAEPFVLQSGYDDLVWYTASGMGPFVTRPTATIREKEQVTLYVSRKTEQCITARIPIVITVKGPPAKPVSQRVLRCSDRPGASELKIGARTSVDDRYRWSTGETAFEIPLPAADGKYMRAITNMCGTETDTFDIRSGTCNDCLSFPNAFTPNGDGLNDRFTNTRRCEITGYLFRIYTRWGQMIFVTSKPEESWDGTHKGLAAPLGTYMYQCTFLNIINNEVIRVQGDVMLLR